MSHGVEYDLTEFYRVHNPAKVGGVANIVADAKNNGISEDDVYSMLCKKYNVAQFDDVAGKRKELASAVSEASPSEINTVLRTAELKGFSFSDAKRDLQRRYRKRAGSTTTPPPEKAAPAPKDEGSDVIATRARGLSKAVCKSKVDDVMAEEVREWIVTTLGEAVDQRVSSEANVVDSLRDGVVLQLLLQLLRNPEMDKKALKVPKATGFYARDNVSRFIKAMQTEFDVRTEVMFDDSDLCDGKNDRAVISCLLALAKITYSRGLTSAPAVVRFDAEIEEQTKQLDESEIDRAIKETEDEATLPPTIEVDAEDAKVAFGELDDAETLERQFVLDTENEGLVSMLESFGKGLADIQRREKEPTLVAVIEVPDKPPTPTPEITLSSGAAAPIEEPSLVVLSPKRYKAKRGDAVDKEVSDKVNRMMKKHTTSQTRVTRLKNQGEYIVYHRITGKRTVVYVRMVQKNLMIRVGGGWDDFEDWLSRHMVDWETAKPGTAQRLNQKEALARRK